jgi:hypothetical protein
MKIIDNFIPKEYADNLYDIISYGNFDWYLHPATIHRRNSITDYTHGVVYDGKTQDSPQFVHPFYDEGKVHPFFDLVEPFKLYMEDHGIYAKRLIRIKANMIMREPDFPLNHYNTPHTDVRDENSDNVYSLLYYLNDSDGDTFIFNEFGLEVPDKLTVAERVTPKKGRAVFFKSTQYHTSSPPIESFKRMVINFVFEMYETNDRKF